MTPEPDVLDSLPHREPFRFVTRVLRCTPGEEAVGMWSVTGTEDFFAGHFPGDPVVPGVLLGESLAQLSGLIGGGETKAARLAQIELKIHGAVCPPAEISLSSRLARSLGALQLYEVSAAVEGVVVVDGRLTLVSLAKEA